MEPSEYTTTLWCVASPYGVPIGLDEYTVTSCGVDWYSTFPAHDLQSFTPGSHAPVGVPTYANVINVAAILPCSDFGTTAIIIGAASASSRPRGHT